MVVNRKAAAMRIIEEMSDDASFDDIIYALYIRQRVERGLRQAEEGSTVSHEVVERDLEVWRRSAGQ
jgi:predicted transcriptional regulator